MKGTFPGYYRPTSEEFSLLWDSCTFFVDANVLLNLYGYSDNRRDQLQSILEKIQERLRMPNQFAVE